MDEQIQDFQAELRFVLSRKFRILADRLNGSGSPTTDQLTACVMASVAEVQTNSACYLEQPQIDEFLDPFRENPYHGEAFRQEYEAVCNGTQKENARGDRSHV